MVIWNAMRMLVQMVSGVGANQDVQFCDSPAATGVGVTMTEAEADAVQNQYIVGWKDYPQREKKRERELGVIRQKLTGDCARYQVDAIRAVGRQRAWIVVYIV
jgi:hypothetical protein